MPNSQQKIVSLQVNSDEELLQELNDFFTSFNFYSYFKMDNQSKTQRWREVKILCEELLRRNPNSAQVNLRLGQIYQYQKNYSAAKEYYIKALTLDKKLSSARAALSVLYIKLGMGGRVEIIDRDKRREMEPFDEYFRSFLFCQWVDDMIS